MVATGRAARRRQGGAGLSIPNLITILRLILVPVIVWLIIAEQMLLALITFVIAGITDAADGFLAKRLDQKTELGAYLDAVADKLLLVSIYVVLGLNAKIPAWLAILVVSRDVLIVGAFILSWLMGRSVAVRPLMVSKVNTTAQIILAALVLATFGLDIVFDGLLVAGYFAVAGLTIASGIAYAVGWLHEMTRLERESASGN